MKSLSAYFSDHYFMKSSARGISKSAKMLLALNVSLMHYKDIVLSRKLYLEAPSLWKVEGDVTTVRVY